MCTYVHVFLKVIIKKKNDFFFVKCAQILTPGKDQKEIFKRMDMKFDKDVKISTIFYA